MFGINGAEMIILIVVALLVIGPQRLPEYAAQLRDFVRSARRMAEGARKQVREDFGEEMADIDWRKLDPRQYDPRRIVKEALAEEDAALREEERRKAAEERRRRLKERTAAQTGAQDGEPQAEPAGTGAQNASPAHATDEPAMGGPATDGRGERTAGEGAAAPMTQPAGGDPVDGAQRPGTGEGAGQAADEAEDRGGTEDADQAPTAPGQPAVEAVAAPPEEPERDEDGRIRNPMERYVEQARKRIAGRTAPFDPEAT
ncbi:twin-arginine translocase TatA/TatE family subunit [Sediminivirga luteola]|uniref:Sec-independent protein translocase protein TatB n=1 Tax=Sediminivirga luteola TaxID=1774748 RepID=A0A8J2XE91_9MICO|nr:twin-arginine translocase TatA/TatE family subunit [Sediminivirga luteola]GGA07353.1 hypothetical protein GCM10011333_07540 [Sediminivirga luteola]